MDGAVWRLCGFNFQHVGLRIRRMRIKKLR
jgi:hypothetical protein